MEKGDAMHPADAVRLRFCGLPSPVQVSPSLVPFFHDHFALWPSSVSTGEGGALFHAEAAGTGFVLRCASGRREAYDSAAELLCDAGVELAEAAAKAAGMLCLHCAAVSLGGRLALIPGVNRSGKSLLAASSLLTGGRVFADDLLAVGPEGEAMAFGLPPRLRLPLPPSSAGLSSALPSFRGLGDSRYRFLYADGVASFGERMPVGAVIVPRREEGASPVLRRLSPEAGLQCLAYQFQMSGGQAGAVFALARRLCEAVPLWQLAYDAAEDAARHLAQEAERVFAPADEDVGSPGGVAGSIPSGAGLSSLADSDRVPAPRRRAFPSARPERWARVEGVAVHEVGDGLYLIPPGEDGIYYLDALGRALWMLLEEPMDAREASALLGEVFPQTGRARLEADLSRFFRTLRAQCLLERARGGRSS